MEERILRGKNILFAEDEESVRWATRLLLRVDEHQVTEAGNGGEALNLFQQGQFDLVITDFQMPQMQGNELAARIKNLAPAQPILMITAFGEKVEHSTVPVDKTLTKPFTFGQLRNAIADLLGDEMSDLFFAPSPG